MKASGMQNTYLKVTIVSGYIFLRILRTVDLASINFSDLASHLVVKNWWASSGLSYNSCNWFRMLLFPFISPYAFLKFLIVLSVKLEKRD